MVVFYYVRETSTTSIEFFYFISLFNNIKLFAFFHGIIFKIYSNKDLSFELVLKLITTNIDYVVFLENKVVTEIIEVFGSNQDNIFHETVALK